MIRIEGRAISPMGFGVGVPGHISAEKRLVLGPDQQVMYHETDSYCHLRPEDGSFVEDCRRVEIDLPLSYPFGQGLSDNFVSIEREGDTLRISKTYGSQSDGIVETYQASGSLTLTTPKWTNPPEGERIVDVYGSGYYVRKAGSEDWIEVDGASEEIYLGAGDSIRGGDTPLTMIWLESSIFGEGNCLRMSGRATLVLPTAEEPTVLDLVVGRIRSEIKAIRAGKFMIRTPVLVTSRRGPDVLPEKLVGRPGQPKNRLDELGVNVSSLVRKSVGLWINACYALMFHVAALFPALRET